MRKFQELVVGIEVTILIRRGTLMQGGKFRADCEKHSQNIPEMKLLEGAVWIFKVY